MPTRKDDNEKQDRALRDSFPASDPPASSGITGPRATPPEGTADNTAESGEDDRPVRQTIATRPRPHTTRRSQTGDNRRP
jgi:hypothetical protein